jgi:quercetin dioxygenase-like cupin family protein
MSFQHYSRFILAIFISVSLIACKGKGAAEEKETTTDTTQTTDASANPADKDAIKMAPGLYKVLADTMGIRIIEVNYKPGDSSVMHWHPDYAVYALQSGKSTFYLEDGSKIENQLPAGMTLVSAAGFHSVKNTGTTDVKVILFEVNRKGGMTTSDASTDATKVSPTLYKLKNDTLGLRVVEVNYKPGQSSSMHSHPDNALYVIEGGKGEFTDKDGKKNTVEFTKGMTAIRPAESHSVKNVGKTTLKAILVEVNRGM